MFSFHLSMGLSHPRIRTGCIRNFTFQMYIHMLLFITTSGQGVGPGVPDFDKRVAGRPTIRGGPLPRTGVV